MSKTWEKKLSDKNVSPCTYIHGGPGTDFTTNKRQEIWSRLEQDEKYQASKISIGSQRVLVDNFLTTQPPSRIIIVRAER